MVSVAISGAAWLDAQRHPPLWRLLAGAWAVFAGVTWIGIMPYVVAPRHELDAPARRWRRPMSETGEARVAIRADPDRVWAMVADITRIGEWSPETTAAEWLDGFSGPVVGARFKGHNRRGKTTWSTTCEVIEAEPGRVFAFAVGRPAKPATLWRYRITPVEDGVELRESFELVKRLGLFSRVVTRVTIGVRDRRTDLEKGARSTLCAIKLAAEADSSPQQWRLNSVPAAKPGDQRSLTRGRP